MKVLIIAAGDGSRWGNYLGVPKHLVLADGEVLLQRTVRLLRRAGVADITVVAPPADPRYAIDGAKLYVPARMNAWGDASKFINSMQLWSATERTIILLGDVFFTDAAMRRIVSHRETDWTFFVRFEASAITGSEWGECFALSFTAAARRAAAAGLLRIVKLDRRGALRRSGAWELYRAMLGVPDRRMRRHIRGTHAVEIDDFTEDFDFPRDYDRWTARWQAMRRARETWRDEPPSGERVCSS